MHHSQAIGIWLFGAISGALLSWFQQVSSAQSYRQKLETQIDQALFGRSRRPVLPSIRQHRGKANVPRVLLAENDDAVRDMLRESLERDGFEVVAVATVADALSCIRSEDFDASLSDLHMPQAKDGAAIVRAMRNSHSKAATLVLSSYGALDEDLIATHLQSDEILEKPVHIAYLRQILREKLANSSHPAKRNRLLTRCVDPHSFAFGASQGQESGRTRDVPAKIFVERQAGTSQSSRTVAV